MNIFEKMAYKSRASTKLWQIFQEDEKFRLIALSNFKLCMAAKGYECNNQAFTLASRVANGDRSISVGEFIDSYEDLKKSLGF